MRGIYLIQCDRHSIVGGQEILIEMRHRVLAPGAGAEVFEDRSHVGPIQQRGKIVHDPGDARVDAGAGDAAEQVAQERRRVGEDGGPAREPLLPRIVQAARREQAIGRGLTPNRRVNLERPSVCPGRWGGVGLNFCWCPGVVLYYTRGFLQ